MAAGDGGEEGEGCEGVDADGFVGGAGGEEGEGGVGRCEPGAGGGGGGEGCEGGYLGEGGRRHDYKIYMNIFGRMLEERGEGYKDNTLSRPLMSSP